MKGKDLFCKIKEHIWNISIEAANICNILQRPAISNGLILVKLKRDLKFIDHVYFKPISPHIICQRLCYLKWHNKFHKDISIGKGLSGENTSKFFDNIESQGKNQSATDKNISIRLSWKFSNYVQNCIKQCNSCVSDSEYNYRRKLNDCSRARKNTDINFKWWILWRKCIF